MEIVDDLGKNTREVDRVDSTELQRLVGIGVAEQSLDNVLFATVSEQSRDGCMLGPTWQSSKVPSIARL